MKCERAEELISEYIEGALDPAMSQVFEQHLVACASCRNEVEELRSVFALLDSGLPDVEPPPGFRAAVLNAIREQPAQDTVISRLRNLLNPVGGLGPRRAPSIAAAAALLIAVGGGVWLNGRATQKGASVGPLQGNMAPWGGVTVPVQDADGVLQGVQSYAGNDGKTYHVFGLHLPSGMTTTSAEAYVVQSPDALADDARLSDPASAIKVWSDTVEPNTSVQVPIAVVSNVPAGTSMTVLIRWSDVSGEHKEVCVLPLSAPAANQPMVVTAGEPLYQALQAAAVAYSAPVLLNDTAVAQLSQPIQRSLDNTDTDMPSSLADIALPLGLTFEQQKDGSFLVDGQ